MPRLVNKFHNLEDKKKNMPPHSKKKISVEMARTRYMLLTRSYVHPQQRHLPFYPSGLRYFEKSQQHNQGNNQIKEN